MRGFGTGIDERLFSETLVKNLFEGDIRQAPSEILYTIKDLSVTQCCPFTAVIHAELDIQTSILDQQVKVNNLRYTAVLTEGEQGYRLTVKHISFPASVHEEGEAYPLKELEEVSAVINRLVQEKTATLQQAYSELEKLVVTDKLTQVYNRVHTEVHPKRGGNPSTGGRYLDIPP